MPQSHLENGLEVRRVVISQVSLTVFSVANTVPCPFESTLIRISYALLI